MTLVESVQGRTKRHSLQAWREARGRQQSSLPALESISVSLRASFKKRRLVNTQVFILEIHSLRKEDNVSIINQPIPREFYWSPAEIGQINCTSTWQYPTIGLCRAYAVSMRRKEPSPSFSSTGWPGNVLGKSYWHANKNSESCTK